jgi:hypothetical protein
MLLLLSVLSNPVQQFTFWRNKVVRLWNLGDLEGQGSGSSIPTSSQQISQTEFLEKIQ